MRKLGNPEIESRIIYENHDVGLPGHDVAAAIPEFAQIRRRIGHNLHEADDSPVLIVMHESLTALVCSIYSVHQPAAPKSYVSLGIFLVKSFH